MQAKALEERAAAKAVGIWIRVSTEDQARGESPEHHERRARAYAEARGWTVREVYRLEGVSGMYVPSNSPKYICKRCRNEIPVDDLEAVFAEELKRFVFSPDDLVRHLDQADQTIKETDDVLRVLTAERDRIRTDMDRVMKLYLGDQLSADGFGREYRPLETRLHEIEDELPRLQGEVDFLKIQYLSRDEIVTQAQDLYGRWADLDPDAKRQIVETITERITVDKDEVRIDLCYRPAPFPPTSGPRRMTLEPQMVSAIYVDGRKVWPLG